MNDLSKSAQKYWSYFVDCRHRGAELYIEMDNSAMTDMAVARKYHFRENRQLWFQQFGFQIDTVAYVANYVGRKVAVHEVFYLVGVVFQTLKDILIIPQIEMTEILSQPKGMDLFANIDSVSFNPLAIKKRKNNRTKVKNDRIGNNTKSKKSNYVVPHDPNLIKTGMEWYHGAKSDWAKSGSGYPDLNKCSPLGDFGKAFYLSDSFKYANAYARGHNPKNPIVYTYVWYNSDLENMLKNNRNRSEYPYELPAGDGGESLKVMVFNKATPKWGHFIRYGWKSNEIMLQNYDLIIGPITIPNVKSKVSKFNPKKNNMKEFVAEIELQEYGNPRQVACKTDRAISHFIRKKP